MRIGYPANSPTEFITVPDPQFRDQTTVKINTTFKRMVNGFIVPFKHTPAQREVSLTFDTLKYKKARQFVDFLLAHNNEALLFESDSGYSGEFLDEGGMIGTVMTDPLSLVTINNTFKSLSLNISLQETIPLHQRHLGGARGSQSNDGTHTSFYLICGQSATTFLGATDEFARVPETNGYWIVRNTILQPDRESLVGFTIQGEIFVAGGHDGSISLNQTNKYVPAFDVGGTWFSVGSSSNPLIGKLNASRQHATGFSINDLGYIVGGVDTAGSLISCMERFNKNTSTWYVEDAQLCIGMKNAFVFTYNNSAYVGGGNAGTLINAIRKFDGSTWTSLNSSSLIELESSQAGNGYEAGIIFGGQNLTPTLTNITTIYEILTDSYVASTNLPTAVSEHSSATLGESVYSCSGRTTAGVIINENNEFSQGFETWTARAVNLTPDRYNAVAPSSNLGGIPIPEEDIPIVIPDIPPAEYVVVCGGATGATPATPSAFTRTWDFGGITVRTDMPAARQSHHVVGREDKVFVIDGENGSLEGVRTFWEFDTTFTWIDRFEDAIPETGSSIRNYVYDGICEQLGGNIYMIGGLQSPSSSLSSNKQITIWNADLLYKTFLPYPSSSVDRWGHASFILDNNIFITGGIRWGSLGKEYINTTRMFNTVDNSLANKTSLLIPAGGTAPVARLGALNISGDGYVFTGDHSGTFYPRVLRYLAIGDAWALDTVSAGAFNRVDYAISNTTVSTKGGMFGGINGSKVRQDSIMTYDTGTNTFTTEAEVLPIASSSLGAASVNNTVEPSLTLEMFITHGVLPDGNGGPTNIFSPISNSLTNYNGNGNLVSDGVMESYDNRSYLFGTEKKDIPTTTYDSSLTVFDEIGKSWIAKDFTTIDDLNPLLNESERGWDNIDQNAPRVGAVSGVQGSKIVMMLGIKRNYPTQAVFADIYNTRAWRYDTTLNTHEVSNTENFRWSSTNGAGTMVGDKMYLAFKQLGQSGGAGSSRHEEVDFSVWTSLVRSDLANTSETHECGEYTNIGGYNFIHTGSTLQARLPKSRILKYEIGTDSVLSQKDLIQWERNMTASDLGGIIYYTSSAYNKTGANSAININFNQVVGFIPLKQIHKYDVGLDTYQIAKFLSDSTVNAVSTAF